MDEQRRRTPEQGGYLLTRSGREEFTTSGSRGHVVRLEGVGMRVSLRREEEDEEGKGEGEGKGKGARGDSRRRQWLRRSLLERLSRRR